MRNFLLNIGLGLIFTFSLSSCNNEGDVIDMQSGENVNICSNRISIDEARSDLESLLDDLDAIHSRGLSATSRRKIKVNTKYSGGHVWLAHGLLERRREIKHYSSSGDYISSSYETQWYPLCNWGWSGSRDGYYLSAAFDTNKGFIYPDGEPTSRASEPAEGASEYNYQFKLSAITGIRK